MSKKFTSYEARYCLLKRTCYALTYVDQKLRHYLFAHMTYLISQMDPLKYILQKPMDRGQLAKWQISLSDFNIVYVTQKGSLKVHALAYNLEENLVDQEYKSLKTYFHDKEIAFVGEDIFEEYKGWKMFFNGAKNLNGSGIEAIWSHQYVNIIPHHSSLDLIALITWQNMRLLHCISD